MKSRPSVKELCKAESQMNRGEFGIDSVWANKACLTGKPMIRTLRKPIMTS